MAKFNPFLGTQVGSVGDVVMYRRNGVQVQRARIREVKNPRTEAQAKNRAVLATMGAAYSYMQAIIDHSFQNKNSKSANMQEFQRLNQGIARALDNAPAFDAQQYNYNFKGESVLRPNPYAIARGTLPSVQIVAPAEGAFDDGFQFTPAVGNVLFGSGAAQLTYQQVADLFGVELGSQLTFCIISDDTFTGTPAADNMPASFGNFHYARVILAPDDMDGSKLFWTVTGTNYTVNNANSRNQGSVNFDDGVIVVAGKRYPLAAGVIVSNYNGKWLRSNTDMVVAADYVYSNGMAEVFNSYMNAEGEQPASPLYLNQSVAINSASPEGNVLVGVKTNPNAEEYVVPVQGVYSVSPEPVFVVKKIPTRITVDGEGKVFSIAIVTDGVSVTLNNSLSTGNRTVVIDELTIALYVEA